MSENVFAVQSPLMELVPLVPAGTMAYFYSSVHAQAFADAIDAPTSIVEIPVEEAISHLN